MGGFDDGHATGLPPLSPARSRDGSDYAQPSAQVRQSQLLRRRPATTPPRSPSPQGISRRVGGPWLLGRSWFQLLIAAFLAVRSPRSPFWVTTPGTGRSSPAGEPATCSGSCTATYSPVCPSAGGSTNTAATAPTRTPPEAPTRTLGPGTDFTRAQAQVRTSTLARILTRNQSWLFFPMLLLEGINLRVSSVRSLLDGTRRRHSRPVEAALLAARAAAYLSVLVLVLRRGRRSRSSRSSKGCSACTLAPRSLPITKRMPISRAGDKTDYLRRQVLTARNIRGGRCVDFTFGGLNYQIGHHLCPSMPRPDLRRAQGLVRSFCADHDNRLQRRQAAGLLRPDAAPSARHRRARHVSGGAGRCQPAGRRRALV